MPQEKKNNKLAETIGFLSLNSNDKVIGLLLMIVVGIVPVIVRYTTRAVPPELSGIMVSEAVEDMFSCYKSWTFMLCGGLILFFIVSDYLTNNKRFEWRKYINPVVCAALVYLFFVLLSSIFSPYPYTVLYGTVDRYESVFVLFAYMVFLLTSMYYVSSYLHAKVLLFGFLFSSLIIGGIGFSQFIGHDFFLTKLGGFLVIGESANLSTIVSKAYGTLFNSNTFGMYAAMLSPLMLTTGFVYRGGGRAFRYTVKGLFWLAGVLMLIGLFGSASVGGMMGAITAIAALLVTVVANRVYNKKGFPRLVLAGIIGVLASATLVYLTAAPIRNTANHLIQRLWREANYEQTGVINYTFLDNTVTADNGKGVVTLVGAMDNGQLSLLDGDGQVLEPESITPVDGNDSSDAKTLYTYNAPGYGTVKYTLGSGFFEFNNMLMGLHDEKIWLIYKDGGLVDPNQPVETFGFEGYETWASGRGYIWSRSLPMMTRFLLIGSGPDSYINEFPQRDIVGKAQFMGNPYIIVDKAHNLYIQTAITTGGVSMLAIIFLLFYYLFTTFFSLVKSRDESSFSFGLRLAILITVSSYAVSSFATDSTVSTAPVFWVILGLGYALNHLSRKEGLV